MRSSSRANADRIERRIKATVLQTVTGTIVSISATSRTAIVAVDLGRFTAAVNADVTVSAGQTVRVLVGENSATVLGATGGPAFTPASRLTTPRNGVQQFIALDSGTLSSSGTWADSSALNADSSHQGFWFHGRTMLDSLPGAKPATAVPLQIWVNPIRAGVITFFLHPAVSRATAAYAAGRTPRTTITVAAAGWVALPTDWAQTLLSNGGSVGIDSQGSVRGLAEDGQSGAIRIAWQK